MNNVSAGHLRLVSNPHDEVFVEQPVEDAPQRGPPVDLPPYVFDVYKAFCHIFFQQRKKRYVSTEVGVKLGMSARMVAKALARLRKEGLLVWNGKKGQGSVHIPIPLPSCYGQVPDDYEERIEEVRAMLNEADRAYLDQLRNRVTRRSDGRKHHRDGMPDRDVQFFERAYSVGYEAVHGAPFDVNGKSRKCFRKVVQEFACRGLTRDLYASYLEHQLGYWQGKGQESFPYPAQIASMPGIEVFYRWCGPEVVDYRPVAKRLEARQMPRTWALQVTEDYQHAAEAGKLDLDHYRYDSTDPECQAKVAILSSLWVREAGAPLQMLRKGVRDEMWAEDLKRYEREDEALILRWREESERVWRAAEDARLAKERKRYETERAEASFQKHLRERPIHLPQYSISEQFRIGRAHGVDSPEYEVFIRDRDVYVAEERARRREEFFRGVIK